MLHYAVDEKWEVNQVYAPFGDALRLRLSRAGLKQKELARILEVDDSVISRLVNSKEAPDDYSRLAALADALGASIEDIRLGRVSSIPPSGKVEEQRKEYSLGITAFSEYPRLRYLLNVGWAWLNPEIKDVLVRLIELQVEQARNEFRLLGKLDETEEDKEE